MGAREGCHSLKVILGSTPFLWQVEIIQAFFLEASASVQVVWGLGWWPEVFV